MPVFPRSERDITSRGEVSKGPSAWLVRVLASNQKFFNPLCQCSPAVGQRATDEKPQRLGKQCAPNRLQSNGAALRGRRLDMHSHVRSEETRTQEAELQKHMRVECGDWGQSSHQARQNKVSSTLAADA